MLLADANGSYTVEKSRSTTFKLNNKTINEIVFSNNAKAAFNDNGKVNSVIFRGNSAGFNAGNPSVTINKLTIADGASWSSILPGNIYGYQVYSDDKYKWYDKDTAAGMASMSNVKVAQLPVASEPETFLAVATSFSTAASTAFWIPFLTMNRQLQGRLYGAGRR